MIRFFDIVISFIVITLLSPFFLIISLLIVIDSKGGVFYRQIRIGKNFKPFKLIKFRTMIPEADKKGLLTVGSTDSRITKVGKFLRKYKLDELPQFINVLLGHMSIVGPRPEVPKYVELYNDYQKKILSIKPGITDIASIEYFNENDILAKSEDPEKTYIEQIMPHKIELNMWYINNRNIFNYFKVIFKTLIRILK